MNGGVAFAVMRLMRAISALPGLFAMAMQAMAPAISPQD